jgi:hypothetical protein
MIRIERPECPCPESLTHSNYGHRDNKDALRKASFDKCMYCESKISHIDYADIEHIKPKADDKYPELKYDWSNLGYSCTRCNTAKGEKYSEETPYINPYEEDPEDFIFSYGAFLFAKMGNERGDLTITDIGLNRAGLIERRKERIEEAVKAVSACFRTRNVTLQQNALEALRKEALPDKEYSLVIKSLLRDAGV